MCVPLCYCLGRPLRVRLMESSRERRMNARRWRGTVKNRGESVPFLVNQGGARAGGLRRSKLRARRRRGACPLHRLKQLAPRPHPHSTTALR
jgi:hypothetical protein